MSTDTTTADVSDTVTLAEGTEEAPRPEREAAKYRTRLRQAEADREAMAAKVAALQDQALTTALAQPVPIVPTSGNRAVTPDGAVRPVPVTLTNPGDLFAVGEVDRAGLFADDGTVDTARLSEAVAGLYATRPDLFAAPTRPVPTVGKQPDPPQPQPRTFEGAFSPKRPGR